MYRKRDRGDRSSICRFIPQLAAKNKNHKMLGPWYLCHYLLLSRHISREMELEAEMIFKPGYSSTWWYYLHCCACYLLWHFLSRRRTGEWRKALESKMRWGIQLRLAHGRCLAVTVLPRGAWDESLTERFWITWVSGLIKSLNFLWHCAWSLDLFSFWMH